MSFGLQYSAGADCPSAAEFAAKLERRVPSAKLVPSEAAELRFDVELERMGELTAGKLVARSNGEQRGQTSRTVPPGSCAEVAESLSVMMAVMIEERARTKKRGDGALSDRASAATAKPKRIASASEAATVRSDAPLEHEPNPATRRRRWLGLASAVDLEFGAASVVMPALAFGPAFRFPPTSVFSPSGRVQVVYGAAKDTTPLGGAAFRLLTSRVTFCQLGIRMRFFNTSTCAVGEVGVLSARGTDVALPRSSRMLWAGAGGAVRLEWLIEPYLTVETTFDLRVLAHADRFVLEPGEYVVHRVPRAVASLSVGVAGWLL